MTRTLDIVHTTLISELLERCLDAQFDADFEESGLFRKRTIKDRAYWYYKPSERGTKRAKDVYVGPADDPEITRRVKNFARIKDDYRSRRRIVSTLVREARLFRPDGRVGDLVEALWKAGVFRLRACLVGTIAFQTYGTVMGCRLSGAAMQTGDIDLAQFHAVSAAVEDTIPPILDVLKGVDGAFRPLPRLDDETGAARFQGSNGLRVEVLTPHRSSDEHTGKPARMPALGGAGAEPLRFLDFLIRDPVRTVMLHKGGVPVLVPDPARFAVHKLIVAHRRAPGSQKDLKDLGQANQLAEALEATGRAEDLRAMFAEAEARGPAWRAALHASLARMGTLDLKALPPLLEGA